MRRLRRGSGRARARRRRLGPLTARGWALVLAGGVASVAAVQLGQRDLLRLGVLLLALPVVALVLTARARSSLTLHQRSRPLTLPAGQRGSIDLTVRGTGGRAGVRVWLEDTVPFVLGTAPRLPVPPLPPGRTLDLRYTVSSEVRGAYRTGPAVLRIGDPLGLCDIRRTLRGTTAVDVLPAVHPLPAVPLGDSPGSGGGTARSSSASAEADDIALRQYRPGDDLRRVHWRSTARRGEVMVREDERGGRAEVVLLVDRRLGAHAGRGPASSLEWAVSAAASIGAHLQRRGYPVRLVHGGSRAHERGIAVPAEAQARALLHELAALRPGDDDDLRLAVQALGRSSAGMLVALLGAVDSEDTLPLVALRDRSTPAVAILQRTHLWGRALTTAPAPEAALQRAELVLSGAGWRTATASPGDEIADVWASLARGGPARRPA
ncbi:uncharacterized protein (DUF58 family) [Kineococcus xinjiangensis]|uniref:Uncharacterized protein (DUF58 family) n=1 Tax=Kineococcus xinjiangensis TaxID=512762 RepID=A0A2S6IM48_9ACTN|nr:DUF58 domain-containing protein [Kineococcus xinjiangensis]PPK95246.1 uncharacterized protein (DUF58 family) [Kineococcus xinjiangensis]